MVGRLFWYRRHPLDWRGGTMGMPWDLQGVYSAVIDEITLQEGPAKIDLRKFARMGKSNARAVSRMLGELVERGKLVRDADGRYRNDRANRDVDHALAALDKRGKVSAKLGGRLNGGSTQVSAKQLAKQLPKHEGQVSPKHGEGLQESLDETFEETTIETTAGQVHARPNDAHARRRAPETVPEKKEAAGDATIQTRSEPDAASSTPSALPPREAAAVAHDAGGSSLPAQPAEVEPSTPEAKADMQRRIAEVMTSLSATLAMEPVDAQTDPDPTAEPRGHRLGLGKLPEPEGATPPDTSPAQSPDPQSRDRAAPEPDDAFPDEGIISRALRRGKAP